MGCIFNDQHWVLKDNVGNGITDAVFLISSFETPTSLDDADMYPPIRPPQLDLHRLPFSL